MKINKKKNKSGKITSQPVIDPFPNPEDIPMEIFGEEIHRGIDALLMDEEHKEMIKRGGLTGKINGQ